MCILLGWLLALLTATLIAAAADAKPYAAAESTL